LLYHNSIRQDLFAVNVSYCISGRQHENLLDLDSSEVNMLTIMVATAIALSLACIVLLKTRSQDPTQLIQPRPALLTMGVQIVCGDCAGENKQPVKTYLDKFGHCSQCGGRSYLLASALAANIAASKAARPPILVGPARVIPFELPGARPSRSERVAV